MLLIYYEKGGGGVEMSLFREIFLFSLSVMKGFNIKFYSLLFMEEEENKKKKLFVDMIRDGIDF